MDNLEARRAGNDIPDAPMAHTAILIMHGVGAQNPYETLDSFAQGFARHFIGQKKRFVIPPERIAHADWTEAAVHIEFDTPATERGLERLSVFEFYWAPYTEGKVTYRGVLNRLVRTAISFLAFAVAGLVTAWWAEVDLEPYGAMLCQGDVFYPVSLALVALYLRRILVGYVGDVTVYVAADQKEASFKARSAILKESGAALTRLLTGRRYDQVILAGHSLGSAIAYDTINELLSQVWAAPDQVGQGPHAVLPRPDLAGLKGLVTFGSALDKIFYFFREHVEPKQAIRAQILSCLHSFKRGASRRDYGEMQFTYTKSDPQWDGAVRFPGPRQRGSLVECLVADGSGQRPAEVLPAGGWRPPLPLVPVLGSRPSCLLVGQEVLRFRGPAPVVTRDGRGHPDRPAKLWRSQRRFRMTHLTMSVVRPLAFTCLVFVTTAGCGLTATQKAAVSSFSRSTAAVGETTSSEMIQMRGMVIQMNAASYAIMGKVTDPSIDAPKLSDLDHNFTPSNVGTVVQAATALQAYGELLQALVDDTQQKELKGAAESFVASVNKVPGASLSADQGDLIAGAIEQLGGLYIEWKRKKAIGTTVGRARGAVRTVCDLLATEFDPQQSDGLGSQFQKVAARLQAESSVAVQRATLITDRSVALAGYELSFQARKRREEIFVKISKAATGIRDANESLAEALTSDRWTLRDVKAAAATVKAINDTKLVSQYAKELIDSVRILK